MAGMWVLVATTLLSLHQATSAPIVDAPWGRIQGLDAVSVSGLNYTSYLAIPFALPPVGELRFAKPVAHPGFGDGRVFNATTLGDMCTQASMGPPGPDAVGMSEDCLTLNIHVPVSVSTGPKTVMVFIHGGGFSLGTASQFTPSELVAENDVIVVVIQYRLDALGFLSSGDDTVPGNFGLWDQNLALRWVKTNIGAFGGDPDSMTVFGGSAGSFSLGFHVISPASRGLKFRAIMQSGAPLSIGTLDKNPAQAFYDLANRTGCLDEAGDRWTSSIMSYFTSRAMRRMDPQSVLACLRRLNASDLLRVRQSGISSLSPMKPVVDGDFVPRNPDELMNDVAYLDAVGATERDVMLGVNNNEGAFVVSVNDLYDGEDELEDFYQTGIEIVRSIISDELVFRYGEDIRTSGRLDTVVNVLAFYYTQWANAGATLVTKQNIADAFSDVEFIVSAVEFSRKLADAKAKLSGFRSPLGRHYLYLFNHYPTLREGQKELSGTYHSHDVVYEFDPSGMGGGRTWFTADEYAIASTFRTMLTSFAKTGQPQVPLLNNQTNGVNVWPEFTLTGESYLSLEIVPKIADHLYGQRVALWTDLVPSLYNSTQAAEPTRAWTWQQQQQQQQPLYGCNRHHRQQTPGNLASMFSSKGRHMFSKP